MIWREVQRIEVGPLSLELPVVGSIDWTAAALPVLALFTVFRLKLGMGVVLGAAALLDVPLYAAGP